MTLTLSKKSNLMRILQVFGLIQVGLPPGGGVLDFGLDGVCRLDLGTLTHV